MCLFKFQFKLLDFFFKHKVFVYLPVLRNKTFLKNNSEIKEKEKKRRKKTFFMEINLLVKVLNWNFHSLKLLEVKPSHLCLKTNHLIDQDFEVQDISPSISKIEAVN